MSAAITISNDPDTLHRVLPRSATQLERDLLTVTRTDGFRNAYAQVTDWKRVSEPDDFVSLILIEYGFAEVAKLFRDERALLTVAKLLRGKWGTPFAVESMARLMGFQDAEIWEESEATIHFPEFQLDLGEFEYRIPRLITLRKMIEVVMPVRCRFRRVFHGWDERQFQWDDAFWGDNWDDDSGVDMLKLVDYGPTRTQDRFMVSIGQTIDDEGTLELPQIEDSFFDFDYVFTSPAFAYPFTYDGVWIGSESTPFTF